MNDVTKLPKWAQAHIAKMDRQRLAAEKALHEQLDGQTESSFYYEDILDLPQGQQLTRTYIQTRQITVSYGGVELTILCRPDDYSSRSIGQIDLGWSIGNRVLGDVLFQPTSFQQATLRLPR